MQDNSLLLRRAQKGDPQAFEDLMAPHERKVYGICLRMLGNREDALDCAQDAMLRLWRAIASYRKEASFQTWCYRIATNACLDFLRKKKVRPAVSLDVLAETAPLPTDGRDAPEAMAEASARKEALAAGIAALPEDLRSALVLRDVQGFSYEEISAILQVPIGTTKSRISRAREKLRILLMGDAELFDAACVYTGERREDA